MLSTAGEIRVYFNNALSNPLTNPLTTPILRTRVGRMAWSFLAHPVKSRGFPAEQERLVTADDLMRYGFTGF
jgi:hypothetical protein